ncbi:MAG: septum formation initiator family protein [Paludibacteraceae bacterium]|jgi:cell division protein FtsB|nr:septum formation initiator family protein [Paludibacteraceae bacterium]MCR5298099.1 septum formation initiator family protein [Paludibacteraceae bacterium]
MNVSSKNRFLKPLRHTKWIVNIAIAAFVVVYVLFISEHSLYNVFMLNRDTTQLEKEKTEYERKIADTDRQIEKFKNDKNQLERMAREKYMMRKDNEDVFIIQTEPEK